MNKSYAGETRRRSRYLSALLSASIVVSSAMLPAHAESQRALWKTQQIRFVYRGYTTMYACSVLEAKVRQILGALGAQDGTKVDAQHCNVVHAASTAAMQTASLQIDVVSAAPATPELKNTLASQSSRRELLSRLGVEQATADEFPAEWHGVDVASLRQIRLTAGDCELIRQLRDQVFPKLAIQVIASDRSCSLAPHRLREPRLKVLALLPATQPDALPSDAG